jgi:hypothetical protein
VFSAAAQRDELAQDQSCCQPRLLLVAHIIS